MSRVSDVARPNSVETTNLEHVTQNIHALEQQRGSHSSRRVSGGIIAQNLRRQTRYGTSAGVLVSAAVPVTPDRHPTARRGPAR